MVSGELLFFFWKTFGEFCYKIGNFGRNILGLTLGSHFNCIYPSPCQQSLVTHQPGGMFWNLELPSLGVITTRCSGKVTIQLSVVSRKAILLTFLLWINRQVWYCAGHWTNLSMLRSSLGGVGAGGRKRGGKGWAQGNFFFESCDKHQQIISSIKNVR